MKKLTIKKTFFFISFISIISIFLGFSQTAGASGCGYICDSSATTNQLAYCIKVRGTGSTIGTTFGYNNNVADCSGASNCPMNSVPICCCTPPNSIIVPNSGMTVTSAATKTLFTIPDFQVQIPGLSKLATITCTTGKECDIPWIGQYISGIYNYALAIVGIIAAIVLMAGGLMWIISAGDVSKIAKAKELIIGSVSGLAILIFSYTILDTINPDLVNLSGVSIIPIARQDVTPLPSDPTSFAAKCKPATTGNCAVANMSGFGTRANEASGICMAESSGNANVYNSLTGCTGGGYAVWGLFQFNLSANTFIDENGKTLNCPSAFNKAWVNSSPTCTIINKDLYNACVKAARTPQLSILNAQKLVTTKNWGPWEANSKFCKF
jgi:hypothetical protein